MSKSIGQRLFAVRCKREMSRTALANLLGEEVTTVRGWELGLWEPRDEKMPRLEKWLVKHEKNGRG